MATNLPASKDTFTAPTAGQPLNSPSQVAAVTQLQSAMDAVETMVVGTYRAGPPSGGDDGGTLNTLMGEANAAGQAFIEVGAGDYIVDTPLAIPVDTMVLCDQNTQFLVETTGGADAITLADGATLKFRGRGQGRLDASPNILTSSACNVARVVTNLTKNGTQEYAYLEGANIEAGSSGTVSVALVDFVSLYVNSGIKECILGANCVAPTALRVAGGTGGGGGPFYIDNVWCNWGTGDNIVFTENNPSEGPLVIWCRNLTSEHPGASSKTGPTQSGTGGHNLNVIGYEGIMLEISHFHTENDVPSSSGLKSAGIKVNGAAHLLVDGWSLLSGSPSNKYGMYIGTDSYRVGARAIYNPNSINPVIYDATGNTQTIVGPHVGEYRGANTKWTTFGALTIPEYTTGAAPNYAEGVMYYDTTLHKLRIGGVSGYETITSV